MGTAFLGNRVVGVVLWESRVRLESSRGRRDDRCGHSPLLPRSIPLHALPARFRRVTDPYRTTAWTLIRSAAGRQPNANVQDAWRALIERYRIPIAATLRRRLGASNDEEAVDDFFAYLFENALLARVDPSQGRFRCYIQGVARRFAHAHRRGKRMGANELPDEVPAAKNAALDEDRAAEEY